MLAYLLRTIEIESKQPLESLSPLKVQTILYFALLDYYSITGDKLFDETVRCYFDGVQIDGFHEIKPAEEGIEEETIRGIIRELCEDLMPLDDEGLLEVLYQSAAFLRANLAPGHRLTNIILHDYTIGQHFHFLEQGIPRKLIDRVVVREELLEELEEDFYQLN